MQFRIFFCTFFQEKREVVYFDDAPKIPLEMELNTFCDSLPKMLENSLELK